MNEWQHKLGSFDRRLSLPVCGIKMFPRGGVERERRAELADWAAVAKSGKILGSCCSCHSANTCDYCRFSDELKFPHMPDMVFPDNILCLNYAKGGCIQFTALDAMKQIDINRIPIQVACADEWQESRVGTEQKIKSFDWTFTTDYKGTFKDGLKTEPTTDRIDMDLLKKKEMILFYEDISLYEDELHDHGIASCSVKIRIMPSCWFVLLRYFLRVDDVISKLNDTRLFYQLNAPHVLIEYTSRESPLPELKLPPHIYTDPNELSRHLPVTSQTFSKIVLPS